MKLRSWFLALALATGVSAPVVGPAATACAAEGNRAALVVDTGRGQVLEMCVELNDDSVSGIDLIRLANQQHDLDYVLGYGGRGVCRLANVPDERPSEECLNDHDEFWGYWRGDANGGWTWSGVGAASTTVEDGDVEGWSYGVGRDGSSHAPLARADGTGYTFESICAAEEKESSDEDSNEEAPGTDELESGGGGDDSQGNEPAPDDKSQPEDKEEGSLPPAASPEPEPDERLIDSAPDVSELEVAPTPTTESGELPASATSAQSEDSDQPPVAGILALLATMGMAGIAFYIVRKRTPEKKN